MTVLAAEAAGSTGAATAGATGAGAGAGAAAGAGRAAGAAGGAGGAQSASAASGGSRAAQSAGQAGRNAEKAAEGAASKAGKAAGSVKVPAVVSKVRGGSHAGLKVEYVAAILMLLIWPLADRQAIDSRTKFGNWARQMVALTLAYAILLGIGSIGKRTNRFATLFGLLILVVLALSRQGRAGAMLGPQVLQGIVRILSPSRNRQPAPGGLVGRAVGNLQGFASAPADVTEDETATGGGGGQNSGASASSAGAVNRQRARNRGPATGGAPSRAPSRSVRPTPGLSRLLPELGGPAPKGRLGSDTLKLPLITPEAPRGIPRSNYTRNGQARAPIVAPGGNRISPRSGRRIPRGQIPI